MDENVYKVPIAGQRRGAQVCDHPEGGLLEEYVERGLQVHGHHVHHLVVADDKFCGGHPLKDLRQRQGLTHAMPAAAPIVPLGEDFLECHVCV